MTANEIRELRALSAASLAEILGRELVAQLVEQNDLLRQHVDLQRQAIELHKRQYAEGRDPDTVAAFSLAVSDSVSKLSSSSKKGRG